MGAVDWLAMAPCGDSACASGTPARDEGMRIETEGTITILPDGGINVTGFVVHGGTPADLEGLVRARVRQAAATFDTTDDLRPEYDS